MQTINLKKIKLSKQAKALIDNLKDFNLEDFLDWYTENKLEIGNAHVIEYLTKRGVLNDSQNK